LRIFVRARAFAHEHQARLRIAGSKDKIRPAGVELASGAISDFGAKGGQGIGIRTAGRLRRCL